MSQTSVSTLTVALLDSLLIQFTLTLADIIVQKGSRELLRVIIYMLACDFYIHHSGLIWILSRVLDLKSLNISQLGNQMAIKQEGIMSEC